jgi:hypothetical protein
MRIVLVVAALTAANTFGALGYTPAAGVRYAWRKLDRTVTSALASVP